MKTTFVHLQLILPFILVSKIHAGLMSYNPNFNFARTPRRNSINWPNLRSTAAFNGYTKHHDDFFKDNRYGLPFLQGRNVYHTTQNYQQPMNKYAHPRWPIRRNSVISSNKPKQFIDNPNNIMTNIQTAAQPFEYQQNKNDILEQPIVSNYRMLDTSKIFFLLSAKDVQNFKFLFEPENKQLTDINYKIDDQSFYKKPYDTAGHNAEKELIIRVLPEPPTVRNYNTTINGDKPKLDTNNALRILDAIIAASDTESHGGAETNGVTLNNIISSDTSPIKRDIAATEIFAKEGYKYNATHNSLEEVDFSTWW